MTNGRVRQPSAVLTKTKLLGVMEMANFMLRDCAFCGNSFLPSSSKNKYCSFECRFLEIVARFNGVDGCWEWPMSINVQTGYGQFVIRVGGKSINIAAHRMSFSVLVCGISDGMGILHRCDNRSCFNPKHLFQGTAADNMADMCAKGRSAKRSLTAYRGNDHWTRKNPEKITYGEQRYQSVLTEDNVLEIRSSSETGRALARKFGVTPSAISAVKNKKSWQHV